MFGILGIGLSGLECWVSLTKECWVHIQQDILLLSSLSSLHMLENDQGNIYKLGMKSIHSYRSFSLEEPEKGHRSKDAPVER